MRVAVLAIDGMEDSGLTSVLDVLSGANVPAAEAEFTAPPFDVTVVARGRRALTAHGLSVPALAWEDARTAPPDLFVRPSVGVLDGGYRSADALRALLRRRRGRSVRDARAGSS